MHWLANKTLEIKNIYGPGSLTAAADVDPKLVKLDCLLSIYQELSKHNKRPAARHMLNADRQGIK